MQALDSSGSSRSRRGLLVALTALAVSAFVAWIYSAPYRALRDIREAAVEKDTDRLAELVDFPAVREHLKEQFNAAMVESLTDPTSAEGSNPFAAAGQALGMMLARSMVDTLVDGIVSPSGIAAMTGGTRPDPSGGPAPVSPPGSEIVRTARYDSLSRFTVRFLDARSESPQVALHLRRHGFGWQLSSVDLPALTDPDGSALRSDPEAAKRTVTDMRDVGTAMMSWTTDQTSAAAAGQSVVVLADYPLASAEQVAQILVPSYIGNVPTVDGWGHPYEYYLERASFSKRQLMLIRSPGRDGEFGASSYAPGPFDPNDFDEDIVWADGFFLRWPQRS